MTWAPPRPPSPLVSRAGWHAQPPTARQPLDPTLARGLAVHYSAMLADWVSDHAQCASRVLAIQRFHMQDKGWADIAYNWLVCHHGYRFVGRGLGVRSAAQGTTEGNDAFHAVAFLGADNVARDDVTDPGRRAIVDCIWAVRGWAPRATEVRPHSFFRATACPGDELRGWVAQGCPDPPPAPAPTPDWTTEVIRMLPLVDCRPGRPTTGKGPWVRKVQGLLVAHNYTMPVDGVVGPRTEAAVLSFQRSAQLQPDALVGRATWTALLTR